MELDNQLTGQVIGIAMDVHRALGPGLAEPPYREALFVALQHGKLDVQHEYPLPLVYAGTRLDAGYRLDLLVEQILPLELKSVTVLRPIHEAQLLTYLRIGRYRLG